MGDGEGPVRPSWSWRRPFLHEVYIDCLGDYWEICSSKTQVGWLWNGPGNCSWKAAKLPTVPRMPGFEIVLDHSKKKKKKNPFFLWCFNMHSFFVFWEVLWKEQLVLALPWMFTFLLLFFFFYYRKKKFLASFNLLPEQSDLLPSPF